MLFVFINKKTSIIWFSITVNHLRLSWRLRLLHLVSILCWRSLNKENLLIWISFLNTAVTYKAKGKPWWCAETLQGKPGNATKKILLWMCTAMMRSIITNAAVSWSKRINLVSARNNLSKGQKLQCVYETRIMRTWQQLLT